MHTTLFNVLPVELDRKEINKMVAATSEYFQERGKVDCTKDEFAFLMTLDRYIEMFEKAKSMVANDRFTVEFKGDKDQQTLTLNDFEIIPIKKTG
jgi:hypothetical protein